MFDAVKVLGGMLEQAGGGTAQSRLQQAMQKPGGTNSLGDILGQFAGGAGTAGGLGGMLSGMLAKANTAASGAATQVGNAAAAPGGLGDILGNLAGMARQAATTTRDEAGKNNPVAVGGLGAIAGALLGGGRGAVGGGLMAVLGSLAYSAVQNAVAANAQAAQPAPAPLAPPAILPGYHDDDAVQRKARLMLRAMIQAAKADGELDGREIQRITGKLMEDGGNNAARTFVLQEMGGPVDIASLAREVTGPQDAAEVYAASLLAIDVDTDAERRYLANLAGALQLSPDAVAHIHATLGTRA